MDANDQLAATLASSNPVTIGKWTFHADSLLLERSDSSVKLESRVAYLLYYLAEKAGTPVSRAELTDHVWSGIVVGDEALTTAINKLRNAFGDDSHHPEVIKTIPKVGYQLIADVEFSTSRATPHKLESATGKGNAFFGIAVIGVLLVAAGVFFLSELLEAPGEMISPEKAVIEQPEKLSIVVLPFKNMSGDSDQEYFVDGMTEDLITDLSKISALTVISRMSSFTYKGQSPDVSSVANELGISHVVEGSVRKAGNRVRISAQLIDAAGTHIWADRYDREVNDIFSLQDEVRGRIVAALAVKLTPAEERRLARPLTRSVEAYEVYLKALQQISFFNREGNLKSQEMFRQAIELDPDFAAAYSYLAQAYSLAAENRWTDNRDELIDLAVTTAKKGIGIDPELPFAHWSLARINSRSFLRDFEQSLAGFEKSIALDPNYSDGYVMLASTQIYVGQAEKALGNIEKGMRINPHFPFWYIHTLGQAQFALTRYEAAEESFKKAITRNPAVGWPRRWLVATYGHLGKLDEAEWEISELEGLGQPFTIEVFKSNLPLRDPEYLNRLLEGARKAGVPEN